jgi:hypothetical protein
VSRERAAVTRKFAGAELPAATQTRPAAPGELAVVAVLGIPKPPRVAVVVVLVAVPVSACSPLDVRRGGRPTRVIDTTAEPVAEVA